MGFQRRAALFNAQNVPPGGVCLSSFVLVRNGGKVLVGKMTKPGIWVERFFVGERFAPIYAASDKYLLPARHLAWYESPLEAAESILDEQTRLRIPRRSIRLMGVQSHVRGDVNSTEKPPHWDICFIYEAKVSSKTVRELKAPPWFRDFEFVQLSALSADDFTRDHGDVLREVGLLTQR